MNRNDSLKCYIDNGVLTIRIGVDALAHAIQHDPEMTEYDENTGEWIEPEITDVDTFAIHLMEALIDEGEDGTTLVHAALDAAAANAIDMGASGIRLPEEIIDERRNETISAEET